MAKIKRLAKRLAEAEIGKKIRDYIDRQKNKRLAEDEIGKQEEAVWGLDNIRTPNVYKSNKKHSIHGSFRLCNSFRFIS